MSMGNFAPAPESAALPITLSRRTSPRLPFRRDNRPAQLASRGVHRSMLGTMKPYAPPPPPGAQPPPLWGNEDHVRALLGERITDVSVRRQTVTVDHFANPETFRDYFKSRYGPTIATYQAIADDADRVASLDRDLAELAERHDRGTENTVMDWEYLLLTTRIVI